MKVALVGALGFITLGHALAAAFVPHLQTVSGLVCIDGLGAPTLSACPTKRLREKPRLSAPCPLELMVANPPWTMTHGWLGADDWLHAVIVSCSVCAPHVAAVKPWWRVEKVILRRGYSYDVVLGRFRVTALAWTSTALRLWRLVRSIAKRVPRWTEWEVYVMLAMAALLCGDLRDHEELCALVASRHARSGWA